MNISKGVHENKGVHESKVMQEIRKYGKKRNGRDLERKGYGGSVTAGNCRIEPPCFFDGRHAALFIWR